MIPLPINTGKMVPCGECALCCTYVSVGIQEPSSLRDATDILWFLYHDRVSVIRLRKNSWVVLFETRCRHLTDSLRCGIYPRRPPVCREYDSKACEVNGGIQGRTFTDPEDFLDWLKKERPRIYGAAIRKKVVQRSARGPRRVNSPATPPHVAPSP